MIVFEEAIRKGMIPEVPVYLDGMISEATAIHTTHPEYLNNELRNQIFHKGMNPFLSKCFIQVDSKEKRQKIVEDRETVHRTCYIRYAQWRTYYGISEAFGPEEKFTLVFVGYQAEGTLGQAHPERMEGDPYVSWRRKDGNHQDQYADRDRVTFLPGTPIGCS